MKTYGYERGILRRKQVGNLDLFLFFLVVGVAGGLNLILHMILYDFLCAKCYVIHILLDGIKYNQNVIHNTSLLRLRVKINTPTITRPF